MNHFWIHNFFLLLLSIHSQYITYTNISFEIQALSENILYRKQKYILQPAGLQYILSNNFFQNWLNNFRFRLHRLTDSNNQKDEKRQFNIKKHIQIVRTHFSILLYKYISMNIYIKQSIKMSTLLKYWIIFSVESETLAFGNYVMLSNFICNF